MLLLLDSFVRKAARTASTVKSTDIIICVMMLWGNVRSALLPKRKVKGMTNLESTGQCKHYWILGKQKGDIIPSECILCGEKKDMATPSHDMNWRSDFNWRKFRLGKGRDK